MRGTGGARTHSVPLLCCQYGGLRLVCRFLGETVPVPPHWPTNEADALAEQERLRLQVEPYGPGPGKDALVAGVDVAYDDERDVVVAAAVLLSSATLEVVEETTAVGRVSFPYVP